MKIVKDVLYDGKNEHLDIARLSALLGVIGYAGLSAYHIAHGGIFDALQWGSGWAALCGGNAAWIFARQRYEKGIDYNPPTAQPRLNNEDTYYRSPRTYDDSSNFGPHLP
jgi:hypothetical protein